MSISDTAQLALVDRLDTLEAELPILYGALRRIQTYFASADRLKLDAPDEVLAAIRDCAKQATDAIDGVTLAEQRRGMEAVDDDALYQMNAYGYQALSDKGKLLVIAALKRKARDESKSLRAHGESLLALNHAHAPLTLHTADD